LKKRPIATDIAKAALLQCESGTLGMRKRHFGDAKSAL